MAKVVRCAEDAARVVSALQVDAIGISQVLPSGNCEYHELRLVHRVLELIYHSKRESLSSIRDRGVYFSISAEERAWVERVRVGAYRRRGRRERSCEAGLGALQSRTKYVGQSLSLQNVSHFGTGLDRGHPKISRRITRPRVPWATSTMRSSQSAYPFARRTGSPSAPFRPHTDRNELISAGCHSPPASWLLHWRVVTTSIDWKRRHVAQTKSNEIRNIWE